MNEKTLNNENLLAEMLCISDTKWVLGHWYAKIILNGRTVPDFSSMAGMSQDELGHTRAMLNYLEQSQGLPEHQLEFGRGVEQVHNMELLDDAPKSWADFVVSVYLAENALWSMQEAYVEGSNRAVANLCKKFAEEGYFHRIYIEGWLAALEGDELAQATKSVHDRLAHARQWFTESTSDNLLGSGERTMSLAQCRDHFEQAVQKLSETLGIEMPASIESTQEWDFVRRRATGSRMPARLWEYVVPTSEVAEMARRPLAVSVKDNIDLFNEKKVKDETAPFFDQ